jgi:hypothetical protein
MDTTDTGIDLTCALTIPPGSVSAIAGGLGGCGGASFRTGFGFGLGFCFDFVSGGMQVQVEAPLEPLGCEFSLPDSGGLGSGSVASDGSDGGAGVSAVTGGGLSGAG